MVQRCWGDTYEQGESRRGGEVRKLMDVPLQVPPNFCSDSLIVFLVFRAASDDKFATVKTLVPQCLDMADVKTIQQFFRKTWYYMDAYWYTHL
jgi:hypothetical protein